MLSDLLELRHSFLLHQAHHQLNHLDERIQRIRKEGLKDMIMTTTSSHSWLMLIKLWWMEGRLKARSVSRGTLFQVLSDFFLSLGSLLIGTLLLFS